MTVKKTGYIVKFDYDMALNIASHYSNCVYERIDDNCKDCVDAFNSHMTALATMISMTFKTPEEQVTNDILARIVLINAYDNTHHGEAVH